MSSDLSNIKFVLPGEPLGSPDTYSCGSGTYLSDILPPSKTLQNPENSDIEMKDDSSNLLQPSNISPQTNIIRSSRCGITQIKQQKQDSDKTSKPQSEITVRHWLKPQVIPKVGDIAIIRVIECTQHYVKGEIIIINNKAIENKSLKLIGIIRSIDIRQLDIDNVKISKSYHINDIVLCEIISLGNQRDYYLSTAKDNLGVIIAKSKFGHKMIPISWNKMQCSVTKVIEHRKVAKVDKMDQLSIIVSNAMNSSEKKEKN